jgi:ATP-binding cassette subfamily B multidrug efflux pump
MNVGKRLLGYVAIYKKTVILALFMLAIAVSAELAGPWIAKNLIDRNVMGIELPWYEAAEGEFTVVYNGHLYKRSDHFAANEVRGQESRVLQSGRQFYYINGGIRFDGVREFRQGELTVTKGGESATYPAVPLTGAELKAFYSPELPNMVYWIIVYFILLLIASGFNYGEKYLLQTSANRIIQKLRLDVYGQIQRLPIAYFENLPATIRRRFASCLFLYWLILFPAAFI